MNRLEKRFEQPATPGPVLPQVPLPEFSGVPRVPLPEFSGVSTRSPPTMANSRKHSEERANNGYGETSEGPGTIQGLIISYKL